MYYIKIKNEIEMLEKMKKRKKDGYKQAVISRLKYNKENVIELDAELDGSILTDYLDSIVGEKLFKEEQKKFKDFLTTNDDLFNPAKPDHKSLGLNLINGYFKENELPYIIESDRENLRQSEYYKKTYWIIGKIEFAPKIPFA
jgi:precorrin-2 methylase